MDLDFISQYVLPPLLGAIAGYGASWANWGVEKRRARLARRMQLVDAWHKALAFHRAEGDGLRDFTESEAYGSLRPYLSDDLKQGLELGRTFYTDPGPWCYIVDAINKVERDWKLS